MLHELLFALLGLPGSKNNAILEAPMYYGSTLEGAAVHDRSEVKILLKLGCIYATIQAFVLEKKGVNRESVAQQKLNGGCLKRTCSRQTQPDQLDIVHASLPLQSEQHNIRETDQRQSDNSVASYRLQAPQDVPADFKGSMYQNALATGLEEVLAIYRAAIVKAEQEVLMDPLPRVSILSARVEPFQILLPAIQSIIEEVRRKDLRGGEILELLHQESICGIPLLRDCLTRLLWHCHFSMFVQLTSWMVYGILKDPCNEFFIANAQNEAGRTNWHSSFYVRNDMLPSYIPLRLAEMILFTGKAVRILRNPSQGFVSHVLGENRAMSSKSTSRASSNAGTPPPLEMPRWPEPALDEQDFFPKAQCEQISRSLWHLQEASELHILSLEQAVETAHSMAARHLWQLVVVHADVSGTLAALKDYFLLGKGDLFQVFLERTRTMMRLPPNPNSAEADVQSMFQEGAMKTGCEDDVYFSKVSIRLPRQTHTPASVLSSSGNSSSGPRQRLGSGSESGGGKKQGLDGWDELLLEFRIDWPLPLLITAEALSKYTLMFRHLLRLKRVQVELEQAWNLAREKEREDSRTSGLTEGERTEARERRRKRQLLWSLRRSMTNLVTNLQYYIQVDVLETQWVLLQDRIAASRDFTEIARFHQEFLESLLTQSFQNFGVVLNVVDPTLLCCLRFCREVDRAAGTPAPPVLLDLAKLFQKHSKSLYMLLNNPRLAGTPQAPYLRQLLLRLNFNCYYERSVVEEGTARSSH